MTTGMDMSPAIATSCVSETRLRRVYETFFMMECTAFLVIMNVIANNGCFSGHAISLTICQCTIVFAIMIGGVFAQTTRGGDGM